MRTTVDLAEDLLDMARSSARKLKKPLRAILNEALRAGLERIVDESAQRPYKTIPHDMGLQKGRNLDNVQELLSQLEGDDAR